MIKKYCYFGGMLDLQEQWLNKMAANGYRLVRISKFSYTFETCLPNSLEYKVEFIGNQSPEQVTTYLSNLELNGYKLWKKNINLNYSLAKFRLRLWANKGARFSTNKTTFNNELLIIEKNKDGKPFGSCISNNSVIEYYTILRNAWLQNCMLFSFLFIILFIQAPKNSLIVLAFILITGIPSLIYQLKISHHK